MVERGMTRAASGVDSMMQLFILLRFAQFSRLFITLILRHVTHNKSQNFI